VAVVIDQRQLSEFQRRHMITLTPETST
jgi:hypothetical protein